MEKKRKKLSRGGMLTIAIIWTVTTLLWTATTVLRLLWDYGEEGLLVLTVFALLASLVAAVGYWYRYINYEE